MSTSHPHDDPSTGAVGSTPWDFAGSIRGDAPSTDRGHFRVPKAVERRYLRVDDRYFFADRTLAFVDEGSRIRVRSENREVLHSVMAIVEARGWQVIELHGTEAFREGMWREAALRGIEARGYEPARPEVLQVQRGLKEWQPAHETQQGPKPSSPNREGAPGPHADSDSPEVQRGSRSLREGPRPPVGGALLAAAAAPYRFDPMQRTSYYVTLRTELGERTIWGADLERALAESRSRPRIGDTVVLTQHGTRRVSVRLPARNAEGELIGQKTIAAQRARWSVETPAYLQTLQHKAVLVRSGEPLSGATLAQYPDLAAAAAGLKLAQQYVQRVAPDAASRTRLLQAIRDKMTEALEQGRPIRMPQRRMEASSPPVRHRVGPTPEELGHARS
ncbi:hypothetical protein J7E49_24895 [Variovorax paradoxus]|nr:hypothetical protein [Variovorax paradoxus]